MPGPQLTGLDIADAPEPWEALGFTIRDGTVALKSVRLRLGGDGDGITAWSVSELPTDAGEIDGLPTYASPPGDAGDAHANGALALDHVVVVSPDFERTAGALEQNAMPLRRIRTAPGGTRQGFRRLGPVILELIEAPQLAPGPARFWGLVVTVADLDGLARRLEGRVSAPKDAVQPGRRIATAGDIAGVSPRLAFMSPE